MVARARALDGVRRSDNRRSAEIAHARVELLVALAEGCHRRIAQRRVRRRQDLADDTPVALVVILQPGEVQDGRPDVGLVRPRAGEVVVSHDRLTTVGARGRRAFSRARAVHAELLHARPDEPYVVGVDLGGVVTVIPGKPGRRTDELALAREAERRG